MNTDHEFVKSALERMLHPAPANSRRSLISSAVRKSRLPTQFVRSDTGYLALPVITIENSSLVYRADNGRILLETATYARERGLTVEDLKARAEDGDVQKALHDLLIEKARDERGSIFSELELHGQQTEPLLVTHDGLVVNGNRRLASMRVLLSLDPDRYAAFSDVTTTVLPDTITAEAVEFIEAALQMAPDLKLAYSWINRRLKLRDHARDLPRQKIVEAYRFSDAIEIDRELAELQSAEDYLKFIEKPQDYNLIDDAEEEFTLLNEHISPIKDERLQVLWRYIGFAMIASRARLDQPISHYFPFTKPVPPAITSWVMRTLAEDKGLTERQPIGANRPIDRQLIDRLCAIVAEPGQSEHIARSVIALADTLKADEQRLLGAARLLGSLRQFRKTLETLHLSELDKQQLRQIHAEIMAVKDLLETQVSDAGVSRLRSGSAGGSKNWFSGIRRVLSGKS